MTALVCVVSGIIVAQLIFGWFVSDAVWCQMVHRHPWAAGFWWTLSRGWEKPPWEKTSHKGDG